MALFKGKLFAGKLFLGKLLGITIEISIQAKDTGGSWGPTHIPDLNEYLVTVKITRNNKVWKKSIEANRFEMKTLERVVIAFKRINIVFKKLIFSIKRPVINIKNIFVEVKKNDTRKIRTK